MEDSKCSTASSNKQGKCKNVPLETISRIRRTNTFLDQPEHEEIVSPLKKITVKEFIEKVTFLLNYFHKDSRTGYCQLALKFLTKDWMEFRAKLNDRLNKIIYLEPTLKYKTYSEIESTIMKEWKKNHILLALQTIWFGTISKFDFQNPEDFQWEFENHKNFIAQTSYMFSESFFSILKQKGLQPLDKLTD